MKRKEYLCPKCEGYLKINMKIIFLIQKDNGGRGLILLNPELGDYKRISHESLKLKDGDHVSFFCPICHADLSAVDINKNLAGIKMIYEDGTEYKILFSEILGEKCTYKVYKREVEAFGEDSSQYLNFFGTGPH